MDRPLWQPAEDRIAATNMEKFRRYVNRAYGRDIADYAGLHAFSIGHLDEFWAAVWDVCAVKGERGERIVEDADRMPGARFFPDARLNFAENLLVKRDDSPALVFRGEDKVASALSWRELHDLTSQASRALASTGVGAGDRVAAIMPNMPETCAAMLGVAALGGIWSSCSPDFGERGILDRFGQIDPTVLVACDGYYYAGKTIDIADKLVAVAARLPSVKRIVVVDYVGRAAATAAKLPNGVTWDTFTGEQAPGDIAFARLPFDHPLYILFSSGTTGVPKCIVHCAGGTLVQHLKEQQLHCDLKDGERLFYFSTCGWMMWNWLMTGLASGATLLLYDGSPFHPTGNVLFDYADEAAMTIFGTSAKFIDALKKSGLRPRDSHALKTVRSIMSTGSPLAPESFDFVHDGIKKDVHLASISGGTDIVGCFVGGNPTAPVWRGEIQAALLGMAADVWDDDGRHLPRGKGELVCTRPFPTMPVRFWNDEGGEKYHNAYFSRFPNVWCHGDFAELTEHGGFVIHGRSDATLNPGGVRIGTAEIYAQVEQLPEVVEALAIGQDWDNDVRVVLFLVLKPGIELDEALEKRIRTQIRTGASPRHVPARIVAVNDIPRTKSGKITELAVRDVVHGREVKNKEALANPEALELYRDIPALQS
jgi:acetoacetyl-CoA synthetase